jgi:hypothetical protein
MLPLVALLGDAAGRQLHAMYAMYSVELSPGDVRLSEQDQHKPGSWLVAARTPAARGS